MTVIGTNIAAMRAQGASMSASCLLYTSDAADERSSVDLGGRRIIKKKTRHTHQVARIYNKKPSSRSTTQKYA